METSVGIGAGVLHKEEKAYEQGLKELYVEYCQSLFRYALALTCSAEDAEDAVQEIFVRIAREWKRFQSVENVKAYLVSATRNAAYSILRTRKRRASLCEAVGVELLSVCNYAPEAASITSITLREAFAALPVEQREVLVLRIMYQMTSQEISDTIGVSINTVSARYRYGLDKLRKALEGSENG